MYQIGYDGADRPGDKTRFTGEPNFDFSFKSVKATDDWYLSNRLNLNLLELIWVDKHHLPDDPHNYVCTSILVSLQSTHNSDHLVTKPKPSLQQCLCFYDGL